jgi:hypothetical protein
MAKHTEFYIEGVSVERLYLEIGEYLSKGPTRVKVLKDGNDHWFQVCDADGVGSDPINDVKQCPGSPGC